MSKQNKLLPPKWINTWSELSVNKGVNTSAESVHFFYNVYINLTFTRRRRKEWEIVIKFNLTDIKTLNTTSNILCSKALRFRFIQYVSSLTLFFLGLKCNPIWFICRKKRNGRRHDISKLELFKSGHATTTERKEIVYMRKVRTRQCKYWKLYEHTVNA